MSLPESPIARVTLLLSGASTANDPDLRACYLASARAMLVEHEGQVSRLRSTLDAMEKDLVRTRAIEAKT